MTERDGLRRLVSPVLVVDFSALSGGDVRHLGVLWDWDVCLGTVLAVGVVEDAWGFVFGSGSYID